VAQSQNLNNYKIQKNNNQGKTSDEEKKILNLSQSVLMNKTYLPIQNEEKT